MGMSSAERVESMDGVLTDILILLPAKSIFRFMSVSKRWKNLISNPLFLRSHSRRGRFSGGGRRRVLALIERGEWRHRLQGHPLPHWRPPMNILPIIDHQLPSNRRIKYVPKFLGFFFNSSNGLILCGYFPSTLHVLNPVSKKWVTLPKPPPRVDGYDCKSHGIMCRENTAELEADYTVVRASAHEENNTVKIDTYSSATRKWVVKILAADNLGLLRLALEPVVANGAFHWYSGKVFGIIGVYHPDENEDHVQLIELPKTEDVVSFAVTRSPGDDILWYGEITKWTLRFFMLPKRGEDYNYRRAHSTTIPRSEWVSMHCVDVDLLRKDAGLEPPSRSNSRIILESLVPWNPPVAVLRQGPRVFLYGLESRSIQCLHFNGRPHNYGGKGCVEVLCPYLDSPFLSSYCL